ncbi:MAG: hypothetical protein Q7R56_02445, partial [Nanoarchaeota archaeon]|nr:hypothetical protein [Nanoarchaeota archaeon]
MYKKYITKNGKKIGPYYYTSVRDDNKKVKTIYLGRNYEQALRAQHLLSPTHELSQRIQTIHHIQQKTPTPQPPTTPQQETLSATQLQEKYLEKLARQQQFEIEKTNLLNRLFILEAPLPSDDND